MRISFWAISTMATVGVVSDGFSGDHGAAKRSGGVSCQGIGDPNMAGMGFAAWVAVGLGVGFAPGLPLGG